MDALGKGVAGVAKAYQEAVVTYSLGVVGLSNVPPDLAAADAANQGLADAELWSKYSSKLFGLPDLPNLSCGQFRVFVSLAQRAAAMQKGVLAIGRARIPTKVTEVIVGSASVAVARLFTFLGWTNKGLKNKAVDKKSFLHAVLGEINAKIAARVPLGVDHLAWTAPLTITGTRDQSVERPDAAEGAHLIKSVKTGWRFPYFAHVKPYQLHAFK